jgi:hypothetical protein
MWLIVAVLKSLEAKERMLQSIVIYYHKWRFTNMLHVFGLIWVGMD